MPTRANANTGQIPTPNSKCQFQSVSNLDSSNSGRCRIGPFKLVPNANSSFLRKVNNSALFRKTFQSKWSFRMGTCSLTDTYGTSPPDENPFFACRNLRVAIKNALSCPSVRFGLRRWSSPGGRLTPFSFFAVFTRFPHVLRWASPMWVRYGDLWSAWIVM
jgi:hypothetical protein